MINDGRFINPALVPTCNNAVRAAAEALGIEFTWTSAQVNVDTVSDWHADENTGPSILVGAGEFSGGQFELEGYGQYDVKG